MDDIKIAYAARRLRHMGIGGSAFALSLFVLSAMLIDAVGYHTAICAYADYACITMQAVHSTVYCGFACAGISDHPSVVFDRIVKDYYKA